MHKHANRINYVLNFVHTHCDKNLSLDFLARLACLSKYHFIKVFTGYVGETPINFLKRIRLERAVYRLSYYQDMRITDAALDCGFSSIQSFSRAFSEKYSISPREFKSTYVNKLPYLANADINCENTAKIHLDKVTQCFSLDTRPIKLIQQKPIKVAYIRNIGSYSAALDIQHARALMEHWAHKQGFLNEKTNVIGVCWDDDQLTPNTACKYDVCIQVPNNYPVNSDISIQVIPGGLYTVFSAPCSCVDDLTYIWRYFTQRLARTTSCNRYPIHPEIGYEIFRQDKSDGKTYVDIYLPWSVHSNDAAFSTQQVANIEIPIRQQRNGHSTIKTKKYSSTFNSL